MRWVGVGYGEKLLSAVSDEWVIGNDSSAGNLVLASESAVISSSASMLESQMWEIPFLARAPPCPDVWDIKALPTWCELTCQGGKRFYLVFMQIFLSFFRMDKCSWFLPLLASRNTQCLSIQRMKFWIDVIAEFGSYGHISYFVRRQLLGSV